MSTAKPASVPTRGPRPPGLPTVGGPAVIALGLTLGTILVLVTGGFSWLYTVFFLLGSLVAILAVNIRGLFITAAATPVIFAVFTVLAGWGVSSTSSFSENSDFSATTLLTGAYPLIERFPSLFLVSVLTALVAVMRLWLAKQALRYSSRRPVNLGQAGQKPRSPAARRVAPAPMGPPRPAAPLRPHHGVPSTGRRALGETGPDHSRPERLTVAELAARNKREAALRRNQQEARERDRRSRSGGRPAPERANRAMPSRQAVNREPDTRMKGSSSREVRPGWEARRQSKRPDPYQRAGQAPRPGMRPEPRPERYPRPRPEAGPTPNANRRPSRRHGLDDNLYDS